MCQYVEVLEKKVLEAEAQEPESENLSVTEKALLDRLDDHVRHTKGKGRVISGLSDRDLEKALWGG